MRGKGRLSLSYIQMIGIACDCNAVVHFIGIGGVSVYSLARLTLQMGATVRGSDSQRSSRTNELELLGIKIYRGQSAENVYGSDLVVYSHAIAPDNPELCEAVRLCIPTVSRAEYLGALMLGYKRRIGISGSHGKSTTVAMLDKIFSCANADPTVLSGAELCCGSPLRIGSDGLLLYEACEYKDSFLSFLPTVAAAINLELDHTDYFPDIKTLCDSFAAALSRAKDYAVINGDDPNLSRIKERIKTSVISFGAKEGNDYRFEITNFRRGGYDFNISRFGSTLGCFELNIPGAFNIYNATAAIVIALEQGIDVKQIARAIADYRSIPGRLQYIGKRLGRPVYYDYAHHPTEIMNSINALKTTIRTPISVIFKPHTYSRTKAFWREFINALSLADHLILTDIYPAREKPIEGVSSKRLAAEIGSAIYCEDEFVTECVDRYTRGAIVLMGAGNFENIKNKIIKKQD